MAGKVHGMDWAQEVSSLALQIYAELLLRAVRNGVFPGMLHRDFSHVKREWFRWDLPMGFQL